MNEAKSEIIVYQPNETIRLDVRLGNESVWLTQEQMCLLFGRTQPVIARHIANIFREKELSKEVVYTKIAYTTRHGAIEGKTQVKEVGLYNLDVIISVGHRVKSVQDTRFRQWASQVLREYLLRGYAFNQRLSQLEDKMDKRFSKHDEAIADLTEKVDFFVQMETPPLQGVFYNGQMWDAFVFAEKLIASARKTILLIDNWATVDTLDMLTKKRTNVIVRVVTSSHSDRNGTQHPKISSADIAKFNAQYPVLTVQFNENFHDRFIIIDDKELYLIGASLKDLGQKCFGFTKMNESEIQNIKARL